MKKAIIYGITLACAFPAFAQMVPDKNMPAKVVINFPFPPSQELCSVVQKNTCSVLVFNAKKEKPSQQYILGYKILIGLSSVGAQRDSWNVHAEIGRYKLFPNGSVEDDGDFVKDSFVSDKLQSSIVLPLGGGVQATAIITPNTGNTLANLPSSSTPAVHKIGDFVKKTFPLWKLLPT